MKCTNLVFALLCGLSTMAQATVYTGVVKDLSGPTVTSRRIARQAWQSKSPSDGAIPGTGSNEHGDFNCSGYTASGSYTQLDECWLAVVAFYNANLSTTISPVATMNMPSGVNRTCYGIQVPVPTGSFLPLTLRIIGSGKGEFGVGTTIQTSCSLSTPVITEPALSSSLSWGGNWSDTVMQGFTVDANNLAPSCWRLYGQRFSDFEHLSCENATGTDYWAVFGDANYPFGEIESGLLAAGENDTVNDIFIYANWNIAQGTITAMPSGGVLKFGVTNAGEYRTAGPLAVFLQGTGAGSQPCKEMPTGLKANLTSSGSYYVISSVTATTYGSGCTGTVYATVPGMPASSASYGILLGNTDSTDKDVQVDSVGLSAGIQYRLGGANYHIHPHVWGTYFGIEDWGNNTYMSPELDSLFGYGFNFKFGLGTKIFSPKFVWLSRMPQMAGSSGYYFSVNVGGGTTTGLVSIFGEDCGAGQTYGGYNWFAQAGVGPVTAQTLLSGGWISQISDGYSCSNPFVSVNLAVLANGTTATTQSASDNSTKVATTAYVGAAVGSGASGNLAKYAAGGVSTTDAGLAVTAVPQRVATCGTTATCSNTAQVSPRIIWGTVTLSAGTATVSNMTAWTSTTSFGCTGTDTTAAAAVKIVNASASSIIVTGNSTDVINYICVGN